MFDNLGVAPLKHGHRWGDWMLDAERLCLCLVRDASQSEPLPNAYEIDLERITDPALIVDWLEHMSHKRWASPEHMGNLTLALLRLLSPRDAGRGMIAEAIDPVAALRANVDHDWSEAA